jgi:hypothetical protein
LLKARNTLPDARREIHFTANGRNAIGLTAESMKRSSTNRVLIPAYHCPALVEPFLWHGYEIVFYPLEPDLSVSLTELERLIDDSSATHAVFVRFFGFAQNIDAAMALAKLRGLPVLEDCAHALYPFLESPPAGGDIPHFRICSLNKFLPTTGGGAVCPGSQVRPGLEARPAWRNEAKALARLTLSNRPKRPAAQEWTDDRAADAPAPAPYTGFKYFLPEAARTPGFRHNAWICRHTDHDRVRTLRRSNYARLADALDQRCGGSVLYPDLTGAVPYVLPFLLDNAGSFTEIRKSGVQLLRWEELAETVSCPVSRDYRERLVQIPCHQSLSEQDIQHIIHVFNTLGR